MKILLIGRGGREHAIAWKIAQSPLISDIYVAPGSDALAQFCHCIPINENDTAALVAFAKAEHIDLTIVGPEAALMNGIADDFQNNGLPIFAPTKAAATIEGSKQFAKQLMQKYQVPTAAFSSFSDYSEAVNYVQKQGVPIVIKYDGLAAGKGVVVAMTEEEALTALKEMLLDNKFGTDKVIVEEFLEGPEFSLMALVNGNIVIPLSIAQDHKRAYDGDNGPNTGGMGAYSPVPMIDSKVIHTAMQTIMKPVADALVEEKRPFTGVLYGGLILTKDGPKVIEFNARFGDPETEVVLPRMKSDLVKIILELMDNKTPEIEWHDKVCLGVVLASKGYPGSIEKGLPIEGLNHPDQLIFHAGTALKDQIWVNNGGRVALVVGEGKSYKEAQENAYKTINSIHTENLFFRHDIGKQAVDFEDLLS